ncbi:MAG: hypothetical protein C0463_00945 [Idiomarina sp.]|nr:hypothetical protein [Idiomarina sp.]
MMELSKEMNGGIIDLPAISEKSEREIYLLSQLESAFIRLYDEEQENKYLKKLIEAKESVEKRIRDENEELKLRNERLDRINEKSNFKIKEFEARSKALSNELKDNLSKVKARKSLAKHVKQSLSSMHESQVIRSNELTRFSGKKVKSIVLRLVIKILGISIDLTQNKSVDYVMIEKSGLFDRSYYRKKYPDVAAESIDEIQHYISFGASEGRNPSEHFNTKKYLKINKDVAEDGINPLVHFLVYGYLEERRLN